MNSQESQYAISIKAENFPILVEGFDLCGRDDLQDFLDKKITEFYAKNNNQNSIPDSKEKPPTENLIIFDSFTHAISPAQDLITTSISDNNILRNKFGTTLVSFIRDNIDLNAKSKHSNQLFQYCKNTPFMIPFIQKCSQDKFNFNLSQGHRGIPARYESYSLLMYAMRQNHYSAVQFFISSQVNMSEAEIMRINIYNQFFQVTNTCETNNYLLCAILYNADKIIPLLIAQTTESNKIIAAKFQSTQCEYSPLNWAITTKNFSSLKALIAIKADINLQDNNGNTPLHTAASSANHRAIEILIAAGANRFIENNENNIPWGVAPDEATQNICARKAIRQEDALHNSCCTIC